MKSKWIVSVLSFFAAGSLFAATNDLSSFLQRGLLEEEANHNLDAAISAYQSAVAQFDKERQLAATAIYRLGESLRKQGKTNEAVVQFERIVREFPEQMQLVKLSEQFVVLTKTWPETHSYGAKYDQLDSALIIANAKFKSAEEKRQRLEGLTDDDQKNYFAAVEPDLSLKNLVEDQYRAQEALDSAQKQPGSNTADVARKSDAVNQAKVKVRERVKFLLKAIKEEAQNAFEQYSEIGGQMRQIRNAATPKVAKSSTTENAANDEVAQAEIKWINELKRKIKDSPDLLNAEGGKELHDAARMGRSAVVQFLLDNGADVNAFNENRETPLHDAAKAGQKTMVELLLARGANVNAKDKEGDTALHDATKRGFKTVVEVLLANKADVNTKNSNGTTPLHEAARKGFQPIAQLLLAKHAEINATDHFKRTPLFSALEEDRTEMVRLLLTNKADVNVASTLGSSTPLLKAVERRNLEGAKLLLESGANVEAQFSGEPIYDQTRNLHPLNLAIMKESDDMVKLLLESGANPNSRIDWFINASTVLQGYTPLLMAIEKQRGTAVEILLNGGADPDLKEARGFAPLHFATGNEKIIEMLLAHKADVEVRDPEGKTPLFWAVERQNEKTVELLLSHHANVNAMNAANYPPIAFVAKNKPALAELLHKAGADENFARAPWIAIGRKSRDFSQNNFFNNTNVPNHFTLFELIAVHYSRTGGYPLVAGYPGLPFPDFAHVKINRIVGAGKTQDIPVDLDLAFRTGDCSQNVPLQFGDVVEIPEADHPLSVSWTGLPATILGELKKCLERTVEINVKGKTTKVNLYPSNKTYPSVLEAIISTNNGVTTEARKKVDSFWLEPVLRTANVLLASSDLTRVKIKRTDPATKKVSGIIFNCTRPEGNISGQAAPDFWLQDGDVIEVPERNPNAPASESSLSNPEVQLRTIPTAPPRLTPPPVPTLPAATPGIRPIPSRTLKLPPPAPATP